MVRRLLVWMLGCLIFTFSFVLTDQVMGQVGSGIGVDNSAKPRDLSSMSGSRQHTLSRSYNNIPIREIIYSIAREANMSVVFDDQDTLLKKVFSQRLTLDLDRLTVTAGLKRVMEGTGYAAIVSEGGRGVIVRKIRSEDKGAVQTEKKGTVSGKVIDSVTKNPISGARVSVEGIDKSLVTAKDGSFVLSDIPVGTHKVLVRVVGYKVATASVEVVEGGRSNITIVLSASSTMLSEVITTATGTQKRMEVGNDIVVLNVDSIMRSAPISTVTDILEARVSGLTVQRTSGASGDPSRIRIRGVSSITRDNEPIIIVDGIRINASEELNVVERQGNRSKTYAVQSMLDQIDPNSIESIEIQKGASASALYGSDAANGVIVINTKKGHGGPAVWSATATLGTNFLPGTYPDKYFIFGRNPDGWTRNLDRPCTTFFNCRQRGISQIDSAVKFQSFNNSRYSPFNRGGESGISTSVSGGSQAVSYSITASTSNTSGYMKLPEFEQERARLLYGKKLPNWVTGPSDSYKTWQLTSSLSAVSSPTLLTSLQSSISSSDQFKGTVFGSLGSNNSYFDTSAISLENIAEVVYSKFNSRSRTIRVSGSVDWTKFNWIPLSFTGGLDAYTRGSNDIKPLELAVLDEGVAGFIGKASWLRATSQDGTTQSLSVRLGGLGSVMPIGGGRNVRWQGGMNLVRTTSGSWSGFADSLPEGVTIPSRLDQAGRRVASNRTIGWFIEPRIDLKSKFFIAPGIRIDASGVSGLNGGMMRFPKMNFSYIVSEEDYFPFKSHIDIFRIRIAGGYAGRVPRAGEAMRLFKIEDSAGINAPDLMGTLAIRNLGNTQLRPETTGEVELGFDSELWSNRLSVNFTYSHAVTNDAIVNTILAPSVFGDGTSIPINIGKMKKQNIELYSIAQIIDNRTFGWNVNVGMSTNSNTLVRLSKGAELYTSNSSEYRVGYPVGAVWMRPVLAYNDLNRNGMIDGSGEIRLSDSLMYVGNPYPRLVSIISSGLVLLEGSLRLNISGDLTFGKTHVFDNNTSFYRQFCVLCSEADEASLIEQSWGMRTAVGGGMAQQIDVYKLRSVSASYTLPKRIRQKLRFSDMVLSLQASNLATKTQFRGKDPDINASKGAGDALVYSESEIPLPRTVRMVLSVRR